MSVRRAVKLYESFREAKPRKIGAVKMALPSAVAVMGYVEGIDYRTTHKGKITLYHHDFAPGSRPLLAVSPDGKQVLLMGGRYVFTERGIVDKDARGRQILNPKHGKSINPRGKKKSAWERRVEELESEGLTRSDAQGAADAEVMRGKLAAPPWERPRRGQTINPKRRSVKQLNRRQALALIEECEQERDPADRLHYLQDLQEHWIGHRDVIAGTPTESAADLAQLLAEYVEASASPRNDRTPRATDPTGLTRPTAYGWQ